MSTRALYSFRDEFNNEDDAFNVYVHSDGYPIGASRKFDLALPLAWPLPRFEADEFAAAFVAGNKTQGGNVRLMPKGDPQKVAAKECSDIEYIYRIVPGKGGTLLVYASGVLGEDDFGMTLELLYSGPLKRFKAWAVTDEEKKVEAWKDRVLR